MATNKKYILLLFCDYCYSTKLFANCKSCNIRLCHNCMYKSTIFRQDNVKTNICQDCYYQKYQPVSLIKCIHCGTLTKNINCGYCFT